jgi:SAM-dependent methyltransferase
MDVFVKPSEEGHDPELQRLILEIDCPKKAGHVSSRHTPEGPARAVVVCISNLPSNVGVQKHICDIIGHLVKRYGFEHVFVDGASGAGDVQLLASMPPLLRRVFMEKLFRRAYLTGAEYAAAGHPDWDFDVWGIDDPDLYRNNWRPAERLELVIEKLVSAANSFQIGIDRVCHSLVSSELRDFIETVQKRHQSSNRDSPGYLQHLLLYTAAYDIAVPPRLLAPMSDGRVTSASITDSALESDIRVLESEVFDSICRSSGNPADSAFRLLTSTVDLSVRAFQMRLQASEATSFFAFKARGLEDRIQTAVSAINSLLDPGVEHLTMPEDFRIVFDNWSWPEAYYRAALARSDAMLRNVATQIERRGANRAILVVSGFHSQYMMDNLALRYRIGGLIIMPRVIKLDQEAAHKARILEDLRSGPSLDDPKRDFATRAATFVARAQSTAVNLLVGDFRAYVSSKVHDFLSNAPVLRGNEVILELECYHSDLVARLSKKLDTGVVFGLDQFDYFMAGNEIPMLPPKSFLDRLISKGDSRHFQILNMNPRYLYFRDCTFDFLISMFLERIVRIADRKDVLREAVRTLKPSGIILLLAGRRRDEIARFLFRFGMEEVWSAQVIPGISRSRVIIARKAGPRALAESVILGGIVPVVAVRDTKERIAWRRPRDSEDEE